MATAEKARVLLLIPASTKPTKCDCGRFFYFVAHPTTGKPHPVRVTLGVEGHLLPSAHAAGAGESHFIDCPNAAHHRRARRNHA